MIDYYLKAPDAESMRATLDALPEEGVTVDEIGVMYEVPDEETGEAVAREGYHANVRSEQPIEFEGVELMYPETPWRVFA